ncbi:unnamed protein product [Macrosiphum euphorbiae]|uniref:Uncharacterized protein n=1 Tax=Macrosiphum euphorbiae TaxID=13131 RepID=A0AAV0WIW1_9HEMI|nr:unnamed protein product [Macrosiphum euphorbiae]
MDPDSVKHSTAETDNQRMRELMDRTPSTRHSLKTDCKIDGRKTANHNMNSECDNIVSTPGGSDLQESLVAGGCGSNTRSNEAGLLPSSSGNHNIRMRGCQAWPQLL